MSRWGKFEQSPYGAGNLWETLFFQNVKRETQLTLDNGNQRRHTGWGCKSMINQIKKDEITVTMETG